jgi:thiol-disulfide isomerase/thioredoxin
MLRPFFVFLSLLFLIACSPASPDITSINDDDSVELTDDAAPLYDPAVNWEVCGSDEGDHPCNIIAIDHNGDEFDLYANYGSLIVLDLSAMWCGPCNNAGAHAQEVHDMYADQDLIYVTLLIENRHGVPPSQADIQQWAADYGNTTSPVIGGDRSMLASGGGPWNLTSWPTFFYIDREIVIRDVDKGYSSQEVIYSIEWLLTL